MPPSVCVPRDLCGRARACTSHDECGSAPQLRIPAGVKPWACARLRHEGARMERGAGRRILWACLWQALRRWPYARRSAPLQNVHLCWCHSSLRRPNWRPSRPRLRAGMVNPCGWSGGWRCVVFPRGRTECPDPPRNPARASSEKTCWAVDSRRIGRDLESQPPCDM